MRHCIFCGFEGSDDMRVCPMCHEYKGITEGSPEDYDLSHFNEKRKLYGEATRDETDF